MDLVTVVKKAFIEFNIILGHYRKLAGTWETYKNLSFQKLPGNSQFLRVGRDGQDVAGR